MKKVKMLNCGMVNHAKLRAIVDNRGSTSIAANCAHQVMKSVNVNSDTAGTAN